MLQQLKLEQGLRGGNGSRTLEDEGKKLAKAPTLTNSSTPVGVVRTF
ncbi:hypothetical protein TIFTF001_045404 [Ficus carica]|uniref:Uncharacterized protein n=1 Tax=Ficus carica TaxID=3494 RepID=A0AA88CLH1_FICCA|nr:hypothetical protein TIFTF001_045404 [Ficus carica]